MSRRGLSASSLDLSREFQSSYSRSYDPIDRLRWGKSGEGAEMVYSQRSSFNVAPKSRSKAGFGSTERFSATGYEKFRGAPGPGAYSSKATLSKSGPSIAKDTKPKTSRVDFGPTGEGADPIYRVPSTFDAVSTPRRSKSGFGSTPRFAKTGYEKFSEAPGPGAYNAPKSLNGSKGPRTPRQVNSQRDRLDFGPKGEGSENVYAVRGSFDKAASPKRSTTSTTPRFGPTGYEKFSGTPGPGAYNREERKAVRRPQSAPLRDRDRLDFGPTGEGAEQWYNHDSSFKRAASPKRSTTSNTPRFAATGYEKFTGAPGPGAYKISRELDSERLARPRSAVPETVPLERCDFGRSGEGSEMVYDYGFTSSFKKATARGSSKGFGEQERFAPTGYEKFTGAPGPGSYDVDKGCSMHSAVKEAPAPFGTSDRLGNTMDLSCAPWWCVVSHSLQSPTVRRGL